MKTDDIYWWLIALFYDISNIITTKLVNIIY